MDIFSHGLYGGVAFGRKSKKDYWTAFLFGVGPDLFSFGPYFLSMMLGLAPRSGRGMEPPTNSMIPDYVSSLYNVTHSFIIYGLFFALLYALGKKKFAWLTLGWPLHILVDMPTHAASFFPTPFLWPISDFQIDGEPWGNPKIFFPNLVVLAVLYAYWYGRKKKNNIKNI